MCDHSSEKQEKGMIKFHTGCLPFLGVTAGERNPQSHEVIGSTKGERSQVTDQASNVKKQVMGFQGLK